MEPHFKQTALRVKMSQANYVLAVQDGMELNYTSHKAKTELGRIGRAIKTEQYGILQHSTLCVTDQNEPLGLIDLQYLDDDQRNAEIDRTHRPKEEKEIYCWISALKAMRKKLEGIDKPVITVADREGDFFDFLHELKTHQEPFVIRARHNRVIGRKWVRGGDKLFEALKRQKDIGMLRTEICDVNTHEVKEIELHLKVQKDVDLPVPINHYGPEKIHYQSIQVNAVMAYNADYCWVLLTNLPVESLKDTQKIVTIYKARWHIEDYHKTLKTGYQAEEIYLHASRDTIENLLTMIAISACRFYWMIYVGRVEKNIHAARIFSQQEWQSVYIYLKEKIPEKTPSLSEVIINIARLGGYKPHKNALPPGIKTMWIGFRHFTIASTMYINLLANKT